MAIIPCYNGDVPQYEVVTGSSRYPCAVERGILSRVREFIPARAGKVFLTTTEDVWELHAMSGTKSLYVSVTKHPLGNKA